MDSHFEGDCRFPLTVTPLQLIVPIGRRPPTVGYSVEIVLRAKENVTVPDTIYIYCAHVLDPDVHIRSSIISHLNNLNPALNAVTNFGGSAGNGSTTLRDCRVKTIKNS